MSDTTAATPESEPSSPQALNPECAIYSSRAFTYDKQLRQFSSNFTQTPGVLRYLWEFDLTIGFGIRSARTGKVELFQMTSGLKDDTGRYVHWIFEAIDIPEVTAKVFNR